MYEEARKLGLDAGDLEDYGFETKGRCTNAACINRDKIKSVASYIDNMGRFQGNMAQKGKEMMDKAMCHPKLKNAPQVQFIWQLCPLNFLTFGFGPCINLVLFPFCWFIQIPFELFVTIPWNHIFIIGTMWTLLGWAAPIIWGWAVWGLLFPSS